MMTTMGDLHLGDYRLLGALDVAVRSFQLHQLVIAEACSSWLQAT
jgi:hypothetical protein